MFLFYFEKNTIFFKKFFHKKEKIYFFFHYKLFMAEEVKPKSNKCQYLS